MKLKIPNTGPIRWMTIEELEKEREREDNFWKNFPNSRIGKLLQSIYKNSEDEDENISNG